MISRVVHRLAQFFIVDLAEYLRKAATEMRVVWAFLLAAGNYLLFPNRALMVSLGCVLAAAAMDVVTRWLATQHNKNRWRSQEFWEGTGVKLVAYLVIAFLAGLSYRLAPFLEEPTVFLWTVAYAVMFLREVQSNMENLAEMGADVGWLLVWVKKKQQQILERDDTVLPPGAGPADERKPRPPEAPQN